MTELRFNSKCQKLCKGERGASDSPAEWVMIGNKRALVCPCCNERLMYKPVDVNTGAPNVISEISRNEFRFEDTICDYDVVVLRNIRG